MKLPDERGAVVAARVVAPDDEIFAVASNGVTIRMPVSSVSVQGASRLRCAGHGLVGGSDAGGHRPGVVWL